MTAQRLTTAVAPGRSLAQDPLLVSSEPLETARRHVAEASLIDGPVGRVGLELELHVVDLVQPARRPTWAEMTRLAEGIGPLPSQSRVTLEPGGQIELSTPPAPDVVAGVVALRSDVEALRARMREEGFGVAPLGADLARPVARINPGARYHAMERHFDALGCAGAGKEMMSATAALQVNLDAGPASGWTERLSLIRTLVPMLVAASSTSPYLGGRSSGWHSMRQGTWQGIDHGRSDPMAGGEPTEAWAAYALDAPVMLVDSGGQLRPVTSRVSFSDWLGGRAPFGRRPTMIDLDYPLTPLFPPVRPRGYLEIRCIDALPDRWWPALAVMVTTLVDDPVAADLAGELCAPVADSWSTAARDGLADPAIRRAVTACADLAARRAPEALRSEAEAFAELLASGRTPSGELRRRIEQADPLVVLEEEAHA
jgi:glutamate--cysteine ligase